MSTLFNIKKSVPPFLHLFVANDFSFDFSFIYWFPYIKLYLL